MANILLVDDYAPNHRLMRFVLERSGHTVVSVLDGLQALEQLATASIELLITDMMMPAMDGMALVREIRRDARYKHLPIIFLTASNISQEQVQAADLEVNSLLTKPIDSAEIVCEVERLIAIAHDAVELETMPSLQVRFA